MFWPLAEVLSTLPKVFICCHIFTIRVCLLSSCQSTRGIITRPTTGVHHSAARASTFFHCQSSSVRRDQLRFICDIMHNECYHCLFSKHNTAPLPCQWTPHKYKNPTLHSLFLFFFAHPSAERVCAWCHRGALILWNDLKFSPRLATTPTVRYLFCASEAAWRLPCFSFTLQIFRTCITKHPFEMCCLSQDLSPYERGRKISENVNKMWTLILHEPSFLGAL